MIDAALAAAGTALASALRAPVTLESPELLKSWRRSDVWRCRIAGEAPGRASSVIVKRFKDRERGFDEWASLEMLTHLGVEPPVAPRFLAGDAGAAVFVVEDLGAGHTLEATLCDADGAGAERELLDLARAAARLHVATLQAGAELDRRRDALAPRAVTPMAAAATALRDSGSAVSAWLDAAGARASQGFDDALAWLARSVAEPGPFVALTHGDMAPSNNHVGDSGVRLLDFEYGGVRPALYDTLLWTLFCPFPADLIERVDGVYRETLARGCAAARDDGGYRAARATVAAWRTVDMLCWFAPDVLAADRAWAPGVSVRQAVLWHLERFGTVAPHGAALAPLADALAALRRRLDDRWRVERESMLVWPAFRA